MASSQNPSLSSQTYANTPDEMHHYNSQSPNIPASHSPPRPLPSPPKENPENIKNIDITGYQQTLPSSQTPSVLSMPTSQDLSFNAHFQDFSTSYANYSDITLAAPVATPMDVVFPLDSQSLLQAASPSNTTQQGTIHAPAPILSHQTSIQSQNSSSSSESHAQHRHLRFTPTPDESNIEDQIIILEIRNTIENILAPGSFEEWTLSIEQILNLIAKTWPSKYNQHLTDHSMNSLANAIQLFHLHFVPSNTKITIIHPAEPSTPIIYKKITIDDAGQFDFKVKNPILFPDSIYDNAYDDDDEPEPMHKSSDTNMTNISTMIETLQTTLQEQSKKQAKDLESCILSRMVQLEETVASIENNKHLDPNQLTHDNRHVSFSENAHEPDNTSHGFIQPTIQPETTTRPRPLGPRQRTPSPVLIRNPIANQPITTLTYKDHLGLNMPTNQPKLLPSAPASISTLTRYVARFQGQNIPLSIRPNSKTLIDRIQLKLDRIPMARHIRIIGADWNMSGNCIFSFPSNISINSINTIIPILKEAFELRPNHPLTITRDMKWSKVIISNIITSNGPNMPIFTELEILRSLLLNDIFRSLKITQPPRWARNPEFITKSRSSISFAFEDPNGDLIRKVTTSVFFIFGQSTVPVEWKPKPRFSQCTKCWKFGHLTIQCNQPLGCRYCASKRHLTSQHREMCSGCSSARYQDNQPCDHFFCVNCSGAHPADSIDCPQRAMYYNRFPAPTRITLSSPPSPTSVNPNLINVHPSRHNLFSLASTTRPSSPSMHVDPHNSVNEDTL